MRLLVSYVLLILCFSKDLVHGFQKIDQMASLFGEINLHADVLKLLDTGQSLDQFTLMLIISFLLLPLKTWLIFIWVGKLLKLRLKQTSYVHNFFRLPY